MSKVSKTNATKANTNHRANTLNSNRGTSGNNEANAKANGNRGAQLNPNQKK
ncbi:alpha-amylase [Neptunomonas phycophila]|uniref:alpha-amylase n=1 Tax=Neptunomonas phycophila TaxID=1572645 RepID=UPI003734F43E